MSCSTAPNTSSRCRRCSCVTPFDYFRRTDQHFVPKTSNAALRAVDARLLPPESYIYAATSVRPLDEEPYDIEEIERVLGRENLDIDSNLMLVRILRRLLDNSEQEIALFAAEGINLIEGRYATKIESLKGKIGASPAPLLVRDLAFLYDELAKLYDTGSSLRGFYLHEAYTWLASIRSADIFGNQEVVRFIRILIDLGLFDQAARELEHYPAEHETELLLLEAEIEFHRHSYSRVAQICRELQDRWETLTEAERLILEQWVGPDGR